MCVKAAQKMLMKFLLGVNFIKILCKPVLYKSVLHSFSLVTVWLCIFLAKEYRGKKAARKMLIKLTTSVNFINILRMNFQTNAVLAAFSTYI
jgi:hypothetical protein